MTFSENGYPLFGIMLKLEYAFAAAPHSSF
jgi:hypothetical protein